MSYRMCMLIRMFLLTVALTATALPGDGWAQSMSLEEAQQQGLVGERLDGYIGVVEQSPGVQALVEDINLKRRQIYRDIARKNGTTLSAVEQLAGKKAIGRAASGEIVQDSGGQWVRKP